MNALAQGFYTSREAADLIEVGSLRRIKTWLDGYPASKCGPLLIRDYHGANKKDPQELSFYDLIEVRFVEYFRLNGVKMRSLRVALEVAREKFGQHPFATKKVRFHLTEDKKICVQEIDEPIATKDEDPKLWNLLSQQYEVYQFLHTIIEKGITFDVNTELAKIWRPRVNQFPDIVIDPRQAYGKPIVESGVPTSAIYNTWIAEDNNYGLVGEWYGISPAEIEQAIGFESSLKARRESAAA